MCLTHRRLTETTKVPFYCQPAPESTIQKASGTRLDFAPGFDTHHSRNGCDLLLDLGDTSWTN